MQFGFGVQLFWIFFGIILLIVLGGMAAIVVSLIVRQRRNDRAPVETLPVTVAGKRAVHSHQPIAGDASGAHGYMSSTSRYVRFATADGAQRELIVDEETFDRLQEGVRGTLTVQGTRFLSFVENI